MLLFPEVAKSLRTPSMEQGADGALSFGVAAGLARRPNQSQFFSPTTASTVAATFSGVKPKCLKSTGAGADSP